MTRNAIRWFFIWMRQKLFKWRTDREIFEHIFPHLEGEKDFGYPFSSDTQMNAQTEAFDVQTLFDTIERQVRKMPEAYGESLRYIMHRDLHRWLSRYEQVVQRRI